MAGYGNSGACWAATPRLGEDACREVDDAAAIPTSPNGGFAVPRATTAGRALHARGMAGRRDYGGLGNLWGARGSGGHRGPHHVCAGSATGTHDRCRVPVLQGRPSRCPEGSWGTEPKADSVGLLHCIRSAATRVTGWVGGHRRVGRQSPTRPHYHP